MLRTFHLVMKSGRSKKLGQNEGEDKRENITEEEKKSFKSTEFGIIQKIEISSLSQGNLFNTLVSAHFLIKFSVSIFYP